MKLTCVVCREHLIPSDDVSVAPCGHFCHFACWIEWLERSKNCPQCRAKTTSKQLVRLFLNVDESAGGQEDVASLTNKIDSLAFELRCKNKDIQNAKEEIEKTKKQNTGLKEEIIKYRDEADDAKTTCAALQEKVQYLMRQIKDAEGTKRECEKLRAENQSMKNLDTVVRGSSSEVKNLVETTPCTPEGLKNLALFCGSLKTCVEKTEAKKKVVQEMYESQKAEVLVLKAESEAMREELKTVKCNNRGLSDDIKRLEGEKLSLLKKIRDLETAVLSPTVGSVTNKALKRFVSESPAPPPTFKRRFDGNITLLDSSDSPIVTAPGETRIRNEPSSSKTLIDTQSNHQDLEMSPIFGVKPKIVKENILKRPLVNSNLSIFSRRPTGSKDETKCSSMSYDGFGGHSKVDEFPTPINSATKKMKRSQSFTKKKLCTTTNVPKITEFDGFLDLS